MVLHNYKLLSRILKALGSESGIKIFTLLDGAKEMCVTDIAKKIHRSLSATSHQLKKMEATGLVESWRDGRTICYHLGKSHLSKDLAHCIRRVKL